MSDVRKRALAWLLVLVPVFAGAYILANHLASRRGDVPVLALPWEAVIPFIAWTIVPYLSLHPVFALSFFANRTVREVDRLAWTYVACYAIAFVIFITFPFQASFERPEPGGVFGILFDFVASIDDRYNQAPSLHIAVLTILWLHLRHAFSGLPYLFFNTWCLLVGVSVLTTYQHHFADIPTGMALGFFARWAVARRFRPQSQPG